VNIILPSLDRLTASPVVEFAVICPANPNAVELNTDVFENVPTAIPISDREFPMILLATILLSELVINTCLSDLVAVDVDDANT
jgi:hypothetical protein